MNSFTLSTDTIRSLAQRIETMEPSAQEGRARPCDTQGNQLSVRFETGPTAGETPLDDRTIAQYLASPQTAPEPVQVASTLSSEVRGGVLEALEEKGMASVKKLEKLLDENTGDVGSYFIIHEGDVQNCPRLAVSPLYINLMNLETDSKHSILKAKLLLERNADPNAQICCMDGKMCGGLLHELADTQTKDMTYPQQEAHGDMVRLLVENKANLEQKNQLGKTPLEVAFVWHQAYMAELFLDLGANIPADKKQEFLNTARMFRMDNVYSKLIGRIERRVDPEFIINSAEPGR